MNYPLHIENRIIQIDCDILQSLKKMDSINKKLLLVFEKESFKGVLSIGDIQRAIISNTPLSTGISGLMRNDFVYAKEADEKYNVLKLMQDEKIECMPILNDQHQLVSVYVWDEVFATRKRNEGIKLDLPVVIMAGGQGTRLKPITNILPKPLIPIGEKTIIEEIMDRFSEVGCSSFYLSVNYKSEMIKHYFSTLPVNYSIEYFEETHPLGTAGSLHLLKGKIKKTFFVSNCDIIIDEDYASILKYHQTHQNELTVVSALRTYNIPYGTIETGPNGALLNLKEKPNLTFQINSGMYILEPHLLDEIPRDKFFHITDLIENVKKRKGKVGVFPISEGSWKDIGEWDQYLNFIK